MKGRTGRIMSGGGEGQLWVGEYWEGALAMGADMPAPAFWEVTLRALRSWEEGGSQYACLRMRDEER